MSENEFLLHGNLEKTKEAIKDVEIALANDRLHVAYNRMHYAIFYSVTALAYKDGYITSKHSQLLGWFNKTYIFEQKIFEERLGKIYRQAYEARQECDYGLLRQLDKLDCIKDFENVKEFVSTLQEYIVKELSK